jgi:hypothetical protein
MMTDNQATLIEFKADLQAFSAAMGVELALVETKAALDLVGNLSYRTPKDTGRAAGSWVVSLDEPSEEMLPEGQYADFQDNGSAEQAARQKAESVLAELKSDPYRQIWVSNSLPYIEPLNNGHSTQAPAGFVELSVAEIEAEIEGFLQAA